MTSGTTEGVVASGPRAGADVTVDSVLDDFFAEAIDRSDAYGSDYTQLWTALQSASQGGKRLRPLLLTGVYDQLGGTDTALAATIGAAVELLHTAFVVHDDVIDHDVVRRGRLNVSGTFAERARSEGADGDRADNLGAAAGILAGDLALTGAHRLVAFSDAPAGTRRDLVQLFDHAVYVTAAGELSDVRYSLDLAPVGLADIVAMAAHKTAVYSFELPLQAGAVLAGADLRTVEWLSHVGRLVGTAFQLLDDLDGVFGDEQTTGKSVLTDLGKLTPLMAHARQTDAWPTISRFVGDAGLTHEGVHAVREALEAAGSRSFIEDFAAEHLASARRLADEIALPDGFTGWFESVTRDVARRAA
jgi:geranylgeranyl diphosphate synthase type II